MSKYDILIQNHIEDILRIFRSDVCPFVDLIAHDKVTACSNGIVTNTNSTYIFHIITSQIFCHTSENSCVT